MISDQVTKKIIHDDLISGLEIIWHGRRYTVGGKDVQSCRFRRLCLKDNDLPKKKKEVLKHTIGKN